MYHIMHLRRHFCTLLDVVDDTTKLVRIQRGSTNQATVNFRLCHETVDAIGRDGPTVLDTGGLGNFIIVQRRQDSAKVAVHLIWYGWKIIS